MDWIADPNAWIALATLTALEIVLGVDNIVFISVLSQRLPEEQRPRARMIGLALALIGRVVLLLSISLVMSLDKHALFVLFGHEFTGRDLILAGGGLFLLYKATKEIHHEVEGGGEQAREPKAATFKAVIMQILLLDLVFSLDSVITAVGMVDQLGVMITAVVIAIVFMMFSAGSVAGFIERHPTIKMLALSFLLLVGVALVADGWGLHIPRGYVYFAMAFSVFVELLNFRRRSRVAT
jgi:predicted tellurium resistance membrane protein TerC